MAGSDGALIKTPAAAGNSRRLYGSLTHAPWTGEALRPSMNSDRTEAVSFDVSALPKRPDRWNGEVIHLPEPGAAESVRTVELTEIKVEIPTAAVTNADNALLELGIGGWSVVEDVVAQRAWIVGIFSNESEAHAQWEEVLPWLVGAGVAPFTKPVHRLLADADWRESYKAHFKATKFGRLNWVPVWERDSFVLAAGEEVLWLDPGMAFGTGNHETTRLCCERLADFAARRGITGRVIDAGCGSGILALSAARLGFQQITGFDSDPEAIRVSEENAGLNDLDRRVEFHTDDLVTGLAGRQAELVLANIQADVLMRLAVELCAAVAPGGELVLSGILGRELDAVREKFAGAAKNWQVDSRTLGEWADLRLVR